MSQTTDLPVALREKPAVPAATTPAQAKVDAIAALTMKAYARASTLKLEKKEVEALQADFPDDAFRKGAGGDDTLIYIEHAHLRERLNQVFSPGQWSVVPRNRWAEEFTTAKGDPACRLYVEAMLLVRGAFVAEAVGDMVYYPKNDRTNYGDAVEGAKSSALRRCAKELGVGLQVWKKEFCEGWMKRNGVKQRAAVTDWRSFKVPKFVKQFAGKTLGELPAEDLEYWVKNFEPKPFKGTVSSADEDFREALDNAGREARDKREAEQRAEREAAKQKESAAKAPLLGVLRRKLGNSAESDRRAVRFFQNVRSKLKKHAGEMLLPIGNATLEDLPLDALEHLVQKFDDWFPVAEAWAAEHPEA
jgi:hypothetical protein